MPSGIGTAGAGAELTSEHTDPDQLACVACGQRWHPTSLRGNWWHCLNGCNQ
jgi:hypothetical protein